MFAIETSTANGNRPLVSIVIAARRQDLHPRSLEAVAGSDFPADLVETIVVYGDNPSLQRNLGAQDARGQIIYFLDDDSVLSVRSLAHIVRAFEEYPHVSVVGGPAVGFVHGKLFQRCCSHAMASIFGCGPVRYRYAAIGRPKLCGEEKLILANFAVRANVWHSCGGFDTMLYPNEENEFMRRLKRHGHNFLYHPEVLVSRPPRHNFVELFRQTFRYGQARFRHFCIAPHWVHPVLLLPIAFMFYLFVSTLALNWTALSRLEMVLLFGPAFCYFSCASLFALRASMSTHTQRLQTFALHPLIYFTLHAGYGAGMLCGIRVLFSKSLKKTRTRT